MNPPKKLVLQCTQGEKIILSTAQFFWKSGKMWKMKKDTNSGWVKKTNKRMLGRATVHE